MTTAAVITALVLGVAAVGVLSRIADLLEELAKAHRLKQKAWRPWPAEED